MPEDLLHRERPVLLKEEVAVALVGGAVPKDVPSRLEGLAASTR